MRIRNRLPFTLALVLLCTGPSVSQPPGTGTTGPIVLKAAHLFEATSDRLLADGVVIVEGERISAAGSGLTVPGDVRVIDLGDATLLPGFIDCHVHITSEMHDDFYHDFYTKMLRFPTEQAHHAALYAKRTLRAGVTTIRNVGDWTGMNDIGLRNAVRDGIVEGPRILAAIHAIGSPGGHCDQEPFPADVVEPLGPMDGVCSGPEQCREAVRYQMKWGADVIKICASGGVLSESDPVDVPQLTPAELEAIIGEAHRWNRKVAAHSHGDEAARLAIAAGVDSIEHGTFLTVDTLQLMKERGVYLVPTRLASFWVGQNADGYPPQIAAKARAASAAHDEMMRNAVRIGVPIAFGTDSGVSPHGMNAREFSLMAEMGMSPAAALRSATANAADLLGLGEEIGTLRAGKLADVVAVPGNPLQDLRATEHPLLVMQAGRIVVQPGP